MIFKSFKIVTNTGQELNASTFNYDSGDNGISGSAVIEGDESGAYFDVDTTLFIIGIDEFGVETAIQSDLIITDISKQINPGIIKYTLSFSKESDDQAGQETELDTVASATFSDAKWSFTIPYISSDFGYGSDIKYDDILYQVEGYSVSYTYPSGQTQIRQGAANGKNDIQGCSTVYIDTADYESDELFNDQCGVNIFLIYTGSSTAPKKFAYVRNFEFEITEEKSISIVVTGDQQEYKFYEQVGSTYGMELVLVSGVYTPVKDPEPFAIARVTGPVEWSISPILPPGIYSIVLFYWFYSPPPVGVVAYLDFHLSFLEN